MQLRTSLLVLACTPLLLAGCIFDPADPDPVVDPPPPSEAQQSFMNDVYPILSTRCAACHSEANGGGTRGFVGTDPVEGYTRILAFPGIVGDFTPNAPIVQVPTAGHNGMTYTPAERAAILGWLAAELADRGGPPASAVEAAIQTWSGCLDFGDFTATNMAPAFSSLVTNEGQCENCHSTGGEGALITPDAQLFFQVMTTRRLYLLGFFAVDATGGPAAVKMIPNTARFQNVGSQLPPHSEHPVFDFANSPAKQALVDLHVLTEQRRLAATCAPPRLQD